jgi:hypothetical protein
MDDGREVISLGDVVRGLRWRQTLLVLTYKIKKNLMNSPVTG